MRSSRRAARTFSRIATALAAVSPLLAAGTAMGSSEGGAAAAAPAWPLGPLRADVRVWGDGQDPWSLLPRKLTNRALRAQLDAESGYRMGTGLPYGLVLAADVSVGAQLARAPEELTRFHGFFLVDGYAELEVVEGLGINLNVTALNPSASDGYRFSSQLLPGFAVHLSRDLAAVGGSPLRLEFAAPDLDLVTLGRGLLVEETPLEGYAVALRWAGLELRSLLGGRVFWYDDDLLSFSLSALDGAVGVSFVRWMAEVLPPPLDYPMNGVTRPGLPGPRFGAGADTDYLTLHGELVFGRHLRVAAEYGVRAGIEPRHAVLGRADYLDTTLGPLAAHAGYQFRYYQGGFGPRERMLTPTTAPNLPYRERAYVTNSFEYLGVSDAFHQWSHTVAVELQARLGANAVAFGEGELWLRALALADPAPRVVHVQRFGRAPGTSTDLFYRAGLRVLPWADLPHRLSAYVTNKLVAARQYVEDPDARRFVESTVLGLEVEVFL